MEQFLKKIEDRAACVAVIGLGYVGLPLAVEFAKAGFRVIGIDVDAVRVGRLKRGESYIKDIPSEDLQKIIADGRFVATTALSFLSEADACCICVPTPLGKTKDPDVSFILQAARAVKSSLRRGQLIVLESTTYPGTTRELVLPMLEEDGLKVGVDFGLAFSPERIDPGNPTYGLKNTPRVVGGITPACTQMAVALYSQIVARVMPVSSVEAAEMTKLLENTFRIVNIGLVNEIAIMCDRRGINAEMPEYVVGKITDALNRAKKSVNGSSVLILGVAYKRDIDDVRESPALDIIKLLCNKGAEVTWHDPYVRELKGMESLTRAEAVSSDLLSQADCVVITTDHSTYDWEAIVKDANLIVDSRNATRQVGLGRHKIVPL